MNSLNTLKHTLYNSIGGDVQQKSLWKDAIDAYMDCTTLSLKSTAVATGTNPFLVFEPIDFPANYIYNDIQIYAPTQLQSGSGVFMFPFTSFDTPLTPDNVPFTDYDDAAAGFNNQSYTAEQIAFLDTNPYGLYLEGINKDLGNIYGGRNNNKENTDFYSGWKREDWSGTEGTYTNTDYAVNNNGENRISSIDHKLYVAMFLKSPTPFNNLPFTITLNIAPFKSL